MKKIRNIFDKLNSPYYIYTPSYLEISGGIRALHMLCHSLNISGEEAYVTTEDISSELRTPFLTDEIKEHHQNQYRTPIVVYPEIVRDNPLNAENIVRYLLNVPGLISREKPEWLDSDLIFTHGWHIVPNAVCAHLLEVPLINSKIYNSHGVDDNTRHGSLVFINRFLDLGGNLLPITSDSLEISMRVPFRPPEELAKLYRSARFMYAYEPSTACFEALACGCPVIYLPNELLLPTRFDGYLGPDGSAWGAEPALIETAIKTVHLAENKYERKQHVFWEQLSNFIEITQRNASLNATRTNNFDRSNFTEIPEEKYHKWLNSRMLISNAPYNIRQSAHFLEKHHQRFQLFIRLNPGEETLLADTLDSLMLTSENWQLDIVTTLTSPDGLDDIPCVNWHTVSHPGAFKELIDSLARTGGADWLVELPAGAKLDPLYLWRCAKQILDTPKAIAIFVDDDCCNAKGVRFSPRFKPGVNPTALQSADLAGPLCVRRDVWLTTDGTCEQNGSPWFSKLLKLAGRSGWDLIRHVPDILITYPEFFPSNTESCIVALVKNMQQTGVESEIVPVTGRSWCIRYPLNTAPTISIAILSQGQLDLLARCLESIIEKTLYPKFEIIISVTDESNDPDLNAWLQDVQQRTSPKINAIRTDATGNHASRSNAAVKNSTNDFVLLIREEAVIIQENWLEELVRTCMQSNIVGVSPRLISAGNSLIMNAGSTLGLKGIVGSPYEKNAKLGEHGYLDCLQVARDVSALPASCMLVRSAAYLAADGMDEIELGDHLADVDLSQKLRTSGQRLIYQPLSTVVCSGPATINVDNDTEYQLKHLHAEAHANDTFSKRWLPHAAVDPFWNPNLSLDKPTPIPETNYLAQWQYLPANTPRILARPLNNGQGTFRVTSPLRALHRVGLVSECIWIQDGTRELSAAELLRLAPDTAIVQHYIQDTRLSGLQVWHSSPGRPFIVYALDDLITEMAASNPLRRGVPANCRARLKYALDRCDRMVVSTDFLAEIYHHFISDIRVVPNRLEQELWLPLQSRKRTAKKPRIGWAGGTTHQGDLLLLKEVIEQTRHEADWIFFGMCPKEIRPLISEYHAFGPFAEYPARLAALNLDIAVAPLEHIPFNQGKSNLRLLEYGILGIPVICTDIDPYQNSPACRVTNSAASWVTAIRERIHDAEGREREGHDMRDWVHTGFLLENHLDEWLQAHLPG